MKKQLAIVGASKCNLNCSYCFLHKNPAYLEDDKKVIQALTDGSFYKNIRKTLRELKISPNEFDSFEIWGAETSLHLSGAQNFFKSILQDFPNIKEFGYSSNFMTDINNHLTLIDLVEEYGQLDNYRIPLQISVDGPDWILSNTRHYKYQDLKKNVIAFIEAINKRKLKKVFIDLYYKATLPWEIFSTIIESKENMIDFYQFWYDEEKDIDNYCFNKSLKFKTSNGYSPALVYPAHFIKEDGIKITNAAKIIDAYEINKKFDQPDNFIFEMFGLQRTEQYFDYYKHGCSKYYGSLLFKHDGSLCACSNGILDANDDNIAWLKENDYQEYLGSLNTRPFSHTYKEDGSVDYDKIKTHYKRMESFWNTHANFVLSQICASIYDLSHAGLISSAYKNDFSMIYRHALYIMRKHGCYFTSLRATGNPYAPDRTHLSLMCNGLLEYFECQNKLN